MNQFEQLLNSDPTAARDVAILSSLFPTAKIWHATWPHNRSYLLDGYPVAVSYTIDSPMSSNLFVRMTVNGLCIEWRRDPYFYGGDNIKGPRFKKPEYLKTFE